MPVPYEPEADWVACKSSRLPPELASRPRVTLSDVNRKRRIRLSMPRNLDRKLVYSLVLRYSSFQKRQSP